MEVRFGIAPAALRRRLARAVLRLEALHRRPGFDQRAVDREVIARQKLLHLGLRQHRRAGTWPRCRLPAAGRGSSRTPNDPRPHRRRRSRRTSGTAGRIPAAPSTAAPSGSNRTPATASPAAASPAGSTAARSAHRAPANSRSSADKRLVHDRPDRSQRMIPPNPRLQIDVAEQLARPLVPAAHRAILRIASEQVNHSISQPRALFQQPASVLNQRFA